MDASIKDKARAFAQYLDGLSPEEIGKHNKKAVEDSRREHEQFVEFFERKACYLCGKPLTQFSRKSPCIHWLLKPKGFKKKDFPALTKHFGLLQMQSYLRWAANQEALIKNIVDTSAESGKLMDVTIKYKELEWSFSCSSADFEGHGTARPSKQPHYHFQMRIGGNRFIAYNDFHTPLSDFDIFQLESIRALPEKIKPRFLHGEGIADVLVEEALPHIIQLSSSTGSERDATFSFDTIMIADEGKTISGEKLYEVIQEAKEKGVSVASLAHKIEHANVRTIVSPGPGVAEVAPRSGRRKKNRPD